jgi:hypothetical protein
MTEKKSSTQLAHEEQANRALAKARANDKVAAKVLSEEAKRVALDAAKTARLRALREAREAAGRASIAADGPDTPADEGSK